MLLTSDFHFALSTFGTISIWVQTGRYKVGFYPLEMDVEMSISHPVNNMYTQLEKYNVIDHISQAIRTHLKSHNLHAFCYLLL